MPPKFKRTVSHEDLVSAQDVERAGLLGNDSEDEDDDDFFLKGPKGHKGMKYENGRLVEVRAQVREVEGVMRENIQRVLERGDRLSDLHDRSESLSANADAFSSSARKLQKTIWWRNMKMKLVLAAVVFIILFLIFVPIIVKEATKK